MNNLACLSVVYACVTILCVMLVWRDHYVIGALLFALVLCGTSVGNK